VGLRESLNGRAGRVGEHKRGDRGKWDGVAPTDWERSTGVLVFMMVL
jgi:hypothetical protein